MPEIHELLFSGNSLEEHLLGIERLKKLATHLESAGTLRHDKFDFMVLNSCALAELPIVFPDDWRFSGRNILLKNSNLKSVVDYYFSIDAFQALHLFYRNHQLPELYGGKHLARTATRYEVAANMRAFISLKEKAIAEKLTLDSSVKHPHK